MIKLEKTEVIGWEHAIRGMRNPMNSWEKGDTCWVQDSLYEDRAAIDYDDEWMTKKVIGPNDHDLMMKLAKGGPVHAKYRRMITVYVDITAPLYWWKEFDTYKVGTVANSCSTMHKIHEKEFKISDFSCEDLTVDDYAIHGYSSKTVIDLIIISLNHNRDLFNRSNEKLKRGDLTESEKTHVRAQAKRAWKNMIQLLPSSYNQKRTIMMNYEVLVGMYHDRKNHKLDEWHIFCDWVKSLPYSEIITGEM